MSAAGGNPWYVAVLYGFGKAAQQRVEAAQQRAAGGESTRSADPEAGRLLLGAPQTLNHHLSEYGLNAGSSGEPLA